MKAVYLKKENELKHFLFGYEETKCSILSDEKSISLENLEKITGRAFSNFNELKEVYFSNCLQTVGKESFKNCSELTVFCCGTFADKDSEKEIYGINIEKIQGDSIFRIETLAFSGCEELTTVILPKCDNLIIEKDAFKGCKKLRTVVTLTNENDDKSSISETAFEDCPDYLTFICTPGSKVEQFARENGFNYKNA